MVHKRRRDGRNGVGGAKNSANGWGTVHSVQSRRVSLSIGTHFYES